MEQEEAPLKTDQEELHDLERQIEEELIESNENTSQIIEHGEDEVTKLLDNIFTRKRSSISVQFDQLSFYRGTLKILDSISGEFQAGRLTAILGPSGAGKTTLLQILSGFYKKSQGTISFNGDKNLSVEHLKSLVGYVPQEDVLHSRLTAEEMITLSAKLRRASNTPSHVIEQAVDSVIELLGLEKIRKNIVGTQHNSGVSGGQRKLISIAMELVADPAFIFMDEPTSGLDSSKAKRLITILNEISASKGVTSVVVVHQPSFQIFEMFDDILIMSAQGKIVFNGRSKDAVPYFKSIGFTTPENMNPADYFIEIASGTVESAPQDTPATARRKHDLFEKDATEYLEEALPSFHLDEKPTKKRTRYSKPNPGIRLIPKC